MAFVVGGQASGIQSRSLRTETKNLEIPDGEDVDVLPRPAYISFSTNLMRIFMNFELLFSLSLNSKRSFYLLA